MQALYWPVLGQIQFCSFDKKCKTCLDTKPVFYQDRFCSLTDVIMSTMASQTTDVLVVCSTVCSDTDQRKEQSSASLTFVRRIHRWPVNSPHKGPVTRKMFPFDDIIMKYYGKDWWRGLIDIIVDSLMALEHIDVVSNAHIVRLYKCYCFEADFVIYARIFVYRTLYCTVVAWRHQAITWTNVDV